MTDKHIILTSRGLNCQAGREAIKHALTKCIGNDFVEFFSEKTIMLCTVCEYEIDELLTDVAMSLGFRRENIVIWDERTTKEERNRFRTFDVCYVTEGNTFQIAQMLRLTGADSIIKESVKNGGYYIGASAGAILACSSICTARDFDSNFVRLTDFEGLNILPQALGKTALLPHFSEEMFIQWKNANRFFEEEYDYLDYIPDTGYKLF